MVLAITTVPDPILRKKSLSLDSANINESKIKKLIKDMKETMYASDGVGIADLDDARSTLRTESKNLSSDLSTVTIRDDFTDKMMNTLSDGAANLTLADMNEEGANMLMLQTGQALGTTSLSLASQAAQSVLRLF